MENVAIRILSGEFRFSVECAHRYGVDGAVMLRHLADCIRMGGENVKDIEWQWWVRGSARELSGALGFYSEKAVRRILRGLEKRGAIASVVGVRGRMDKTKWYAFVDRSEFAAKAPAESEEHVMGEFEERH